MPRVNISAAGHASAGAVDQVAVVSISPQQVVTAVREGAGRLKVISWRLGTSGSLTREGDALGEDIIALAIAAWPEAPGVVTAVRTSGGNLKVIAWSIDANGNVQRRGDMEKGPVGEVAAAHVAGFAGVVTPVVNAAGNLEVIAWKLSPSGTPTVGGTGTGGPCGAITATGLSPAAGSSRVAVALRTASGNLKIITWGVSPSSPSVTRLGEINAGPVDEIGIAARSTVNADIVTTTRGPSGDLSVIGWSVAGDGTLARLASATAGAASHLAVTTWTPDNHTYIVGAMRGNNGHLKLIVWRNGADLIRHGEIVGEAPASHIDITAWSRQDMWDGDMAVTASRDGEGNLRLDSWRMRPAGLRLLHAEWPPNATVSPPPPSQSAGPPAPPSGGEALVESPIQPSPKHERAYAEVQVVPPSRLAEDVPNG